MFSRRASIFARPRGFGLLEIILVFVLVIAAGVITFSVFQSAQSSAQADDEAQRLTTVAANLRSTMGINHNYAALWNGYPGSGTVNPVASQFLSSAYKVQPPGVVGGATNVWGGKVYLNNYRDSFSIAMPDNSLFVLVDQNIPVDVCPKLLMNLMAQGGVFYAVAFGKADTSSFTFIQLKNPAKAAQQGYTGNRTTPSFGQFADYCSGMEEFAPGKITISVFGQ